MSDPLTELVIPTDVPVVQRIEHTRARARVWREPRTDVTVLSSGPAETRAPSGKMYSATQITRRELSDGTVDYLCMKCQRYSAEKTQTVVGHQSHCHISKPGRRRPRNHAINLLEQAMEVLQSNNDTAEMEHWRSRALEAERRLEQLRRALTP